MLKALPRKPEPSATGGSLAKVFQTSQDQLVPGSAKYRLRVMLAPICLLLVAGLHWYRVEFRDQSQWKGGGFAMFSTVDSPAARSLRCYLITPAGEIPVEPPTRLEKWISEMRVAPAAETMPMIAQRLEEATWVRGGYRWRNVAQAQGAAASGSSHPLPPSKQSELSSDLSSVTALPVGEPLTANAEVVKIAGVRLELWRYSFERTTGSLVNQKAMEYVHRIGTSEKEGL